SLKGLEIILSNNLFNEIKNSGTISNLDNQYRNISEKVEKQLLDHIYKFLLDEFYYIDESISNLCIKMHKTSAMKLDDKQLCLLLDNLLKIFNNVSVRQRNRVNLILSNTSGDIWGRIIINSLKEDIKIKMGKKNIETELLAFGLLLFNPRIQYNHNENDKNIVNIINSKAFNKLKNYYNEQSIKWEFPIQKFWNDDNN
ncbi:hypothetical protein RFI_38202, partial [Reticulomyxa filosa]